MKLKNGTIITNTDTSEESEADVYDQMFKLLKFHFEDWDIGDENFEDASSHLCDLYFEMALCCILA